ncbi:MAG TPA: glycosyltransferase family 9 protein [Mycobacteriales bacterium]|nr:glycosyltransferase family 9 protein [Mycobacteriales bacterium]
MLEVGGRLPGVARIAVLRANAVGDFLAALPALEALRAAYPGAEIVLLGADWHADFLAGRPGPVDRVVPVPPSRGVREPADGEAEDPAALADFFDRMRAERFDLALQLHGGGRFSNPFVRRLGARCTAGLSTADAEPLDRTVRYVFYQPEIVRFLEVVALVGAVPTVLEPRVALRGRDHAEADAALAAGDAPVVALHPGARDGRRRWPAEHFAAVGDGLAGRGARVVVTGSAAERAVVAAVRDRMRHPATPLAGTLSLGGLAALYARCAVVVSNDTGPRHLAAAVGAPTVAVYWCGTLVNYGPLTRSRQRAHVSWTVHCPVCGAAATEPELPAAHRGRGCSHDASFVASVDPAAVLADAVDLLAPRESHHASGCRKTVGTK